MYRRVIDSYSADSKYVITMQPVRFSVSSVSHALRGQRLLQRAGIRAAVRRGEVDPQTGCGYRLELPDATQLPRARRLLLEAGLLPNGGR